MIFHEPKSYLDTFILNVSPYQFVSRLMVTFLFLASGIAIIEFNKRRHAALNQREQTYQTLQTILHSMDATIYVADMNTYEVLFMNKQMESAFGGEFTGEICWEVFRNEGHPCRQCTNDDLVDENGRPTGVCVWEGKNPITRRWYLNHDRAIEWVDGRIVRLQVATDITQQKEMELERREYESRFRQMQKMESIGRLAGGIAHDLNNLLSPIIGYGEMLLDACSPRDSKREELQEILGAAYRSRDLVHRLLVFSRKQPLEIKVVDPNRVMEGFEKLLRRTVRENIDLRLNLASGLPSIRADVGQIEQVIMNLAVNAQDAMPDGGLLTIESGVVELDEAYARSHEGVEPGRYVMLAVSDSGEGMDAEIQDKVFEPFFTTRMKGKGTGLGLATVYGIIKGHGGHVWVYSEPGEGTTFKCYFPAAQDERIDVEPPPETPDDVSGNETLLVVEDDEAVRKMAVKSLEKYGYTVYAAGNGEECLKIVEHYGEKIDLLITDVIMPDMNGKELFTKVSEITGGVEVIYISGYTDNVIAHHGVLDEGINFVQKPFSVYALAKKVRSVLNRF
jgi:signal transduction histidine kinase/CheY-like chemotaxis protein